MKGLYLVFGEHPLDDPNGISKKIINQVEVFNKAGLNCKIVSLLRKTDTLFLKFFDIALLSKGLPIWKYRKEYSDVDYIYMRRTNYMSKRMRGMFKKIKKNTPNVKIIMEIPTYPYDQETLGNFFTKPFYPVDLYNRERLKGLVDRLVVLNDNLPELWGIPTLQINNGIIFDNIAVRKPSFGDDIHCIAVAMFMWWHGFERVFEGLKHYYEFGDNKRNVVVHMVGAGAEVSRYKEMVKEYNLDEHVIFHGFMNSKEMDEIYDQCGIALCSFGGHKKGVFYSKELKSREYIAKGMPIVSGCDLDVFHMGFNYYYEFPNDDSTVDISEIIAFYDRIYSNQQETEVISNIRLFGENKLSMEACMHEVIDYIINDE